MLRRLFFQWMYFRRPPWDTGVSPPELLQFIETHSPGRALDLGCGTGTNVITLAHHGWQATGVDFIPRAIRKAEQKARQAGVQAKFLVDDVTRLKDLTGPYDLILDIGCFHGIPVERQPAYVRNLERLLAPEGRFMLYVFFRKAGAPGPGLEEANLSIFSPPLKLVKREDGINRGIRPSAWLWFQR
jgi:SAM-dependent methyltransferase